MRTWRFVAGPRNYKTRHTVIVCDEELGAVVALRSGRIPQRRTRGP